MIYTTLTYGDIVRDNRFTLCHVLHMTAVCKLINFNVRKNSVSEFISQGNYSMKSVALNSSHQSDIVVISC